MLEANCYNKKLFAPLRKIIEVIEEAIPELDGVRANFYGGDAKEEEEKRLMIKHITDWLNCTYDLLSKTPYAFDVAKTAEDFKELIED